MTPELRAVDAFAAGSSLLVVSHRPAALALADRVVKLPRGGRAAV